MTRTEPERGFALLIVFLFAAAVAFTMYMELPRAAFESARDKEQLLMDRGNQYKRAIEVYYAVNKRYPPELKDLENTNDKRYLRHRYKDPLTGDDEWRLIHSNGSFLTDSLVVKPPAQNAANGGPANGPTVGNGPLGANTMNTAPAPAENPSVGNGSEAGPQPVNAAVLRRPSDRTLTPPAGGFPQPGNPQAANPFGPGQQSPDLSDPRNWPPITLAPSAQPNQQPSLRQPNNPITAFGGAAGFNNAAPGFGNPGFGNPSPGNNVQVQPGGFAGSLPGGLPAGNQQPQFFDPLNSAGTPRSAANPNPNQFNQNQFTQDPLNPNAGGFNQGIPPAVFNNGQPASSGFNPPVNQPFVPPVNQQPVNQAFNQQQFNQTPFNQQQLNQPQRSPFPLAGPNAAPQQAVGAGIPAGQPNPALQAINNQLFRPNQAGPAAGAANAGPGIAGVASKHEGPSIKSYRERTKYQEWEFVFDPSTKGPPQVNPANPNQPAQPGQNPGLGSPGQQGAPNPFGLPTGQPAGQPPGQSPVQPFGQTPFGPTPFGQTPSQPFGSAAPR